MPARSRVSCCALFVDILQARKRGSGFQATPPILFSLSAAYCGWQGPVGAGAGAPKASVPIASAGTPLPAR